MKKRSKKRWLPPLPCGWKLSVSLHSGVYTLRGVNFSGTPVFPSFYYGNNPNSMAHLAHYVAAQWFWLEELCHKKTQKLVTRDDKPCQGYCFFLIAKAQEFHNHACAWMKWANKKP